ncbi:nuclear transport factor 2 family protein [Aestuariivirga sp. YIM B02566]|uniref:Nuclear transport factor 2 family protein n=1 Tax=Taklimakanibacter albus TaxID=2800327 RepID=A0ACC5RC51_9HYPH|nr:nuclear transport factor 2 family protein [Aestuariivirga sp. YIM B02566]MBK1870208.1 nuclear transport factor 2 family protein [Aestuariivirga sp. YIM B02566]
MNYEAQDGRTSTRRDFSLAALAGLSALALGAGAAAAEEITQEEALKALDPWIEAVFTGDPAVVDKVLAPEFQILRSDGRGHDKASYLKALPRHQIRSKFSDIIATGTGDVMVVRYRIETDQTIDGKAVKGISPRLSVFRREAGHWLISAHANFAALG